MVVCAPHAQGGGAVLGFQHSEAFALERDPGEHRGRSASSSTSRIVWPVAGAGAAGAGGGAGAGMACSVGGK